MAEAVTQCLKFYPETYIDTTISNLILTVQDMIISNPLRSAGVTELETVTLYTGACGRSIICTCMY